MTQPVEQETDQMNGEAISCGISFLYNEGWDASAEAIEALWKQHKTPQDHKPEDAMGPHTTQGEVLTCLLDELKIVASWLDERNTSPSKHRASIVRRAAAMLAAGPVSPRVGGGVADDVRKRLTAAGSNREEGLRIDRSRGHSGEPEGVCTMSDLNEAEENVIRHSLGMTEGGRPYRNHFTAGDGHHAEPVLRALVERGLMWTDPTKYSPIVGRLYHVTDAGCRLVGTTAQEAGR